MATAYYAHRPQLRRNSPLSLFNQSSGFAADAPMMQRIDVGDSSDDDEIPQPMKFSALTKALLESEAPEEAATSPGQDRNRHEKEPGPIIEVANGLEDRRDRYRLDTPSRAPLMKIVRQPTPHAHELDSNGRAPSPRIVQLGKGQSSAQRTVSISRSKEGTPSREYVTPAPTSRAVRIARNRAGSNTSVADSGPPSTARPGSRNGSRSADNDHEAHDTYHTFNRSASAGSGSEAATRHASATLARARHNATGETAIPSSSMRVKRVAVGAGSFLRGAPVRRGFKRRDSDDNPSPTEEHQSFSHSVASHGHVEDAEAPRASIHSRPGSIDDFPAAEPVSVHDFAPRHNHERSGTRPATNEPPHVPNRSLARPPSRKTSTESLSKQHSNPPRVDSAQSRTHAAVPARRPSRDDSRTQPGHEQSNGERRPSVSQPSYKPPPRRIYTDATEDQENMPPPTFKRNKDHDFKILGKSEKISVLDTDKHRSVADTPVPVPAHQSPRKALGALSANTPQRQAPPPPPKMSVLDAATKTAGASTTKSKKRRQHILVNGKLFTQMNRLGKGGSSDVYCVMAENFKLFALKKVKLEDCDETAVRGYKGEIDLLNKLKDVDRVVRLFDWELDDAKQTLFVLMEKGDNDLSRVLTQAMSTTTPKFDPVAARFYWKEMLECVQSVHDYDIVHSDLKPANFLMVSGSLKLIDFGIANAIDIDNTVNVHRDSHIGTPNYMSPESITDTNAPVPGGERTTTTANGRVMKLGKPSDVWSLGCILYQMTYGRPPFAHIANQISRVMAITNPAVHISFPSTGIGGVVVPPSLRGTLRRCLQRNPALRPTVAQLLAETDPWLYPEANGQVAMSEELLGQILGKVVERCRDPKRGVPNADEARLYPASFMAKIREMVEREGVGEVQD